MKSYRSPALILFISMVILCTGPSLPLQADPLPPRPVWNSTMAENMGKLSNRESCITFTLQDRPEYKNRVINHLLTLDDSLKGKIVILRTGTSPVEDRIFISDSLSCLMYEWRGLSDSQARVLRTEIARLYGIEMKTTEGNTPVTFNHGDTSGLLTSRPSDEGGQDIRLYLYPRSLYRRLLEN